MFAINKAFEPLVARLYAKGEKLRLQRVVTKWTWAGFIVAVPLAVGLLGWGDRFLSIFGAVFVQGRWALSILVIGRVLNMGLGMVALLLNMTGHERQSALGLGFGALLNVLLCGLLIPYFGIDGAAAADSISTAFWNILLGYMVFQRMGINPTIVCKLRWRKS